MLLEEIDPTAMSQENNFGDIHVRGFLSYSSKINDSEKGQYTFREIESRQAIG